VDVNIKNDCGGTPLIAVCQQTTLKTEEDADKFINYLNEYTDMQNYILYIKIFLQ
jgi:hypothetical protein